MLYTKRKETANTMEGMTPGRIVHYVAYGTPGGEYEPGAHRAAIITEVLDRRQTPFLASLLVMNPTGTHYVQSSEYDEESKRPGTWHWIERA